MLHFAAETGLLSEKEVFTQKNVVPLTFERKTEEVFTQENVVPPTFDRKTEKDAMSFSLSALPIEPVPENNFGTFSLVGPNTPLKIAIHNVYTGEFPNPFGSETCDLLVSSAIKRPKDIQPQPWAVNYLREDVGKNQLLGFPAATETGTQYVYYSPAMTEESLTIDFCMKFDNFPNETFQSVGNGFITVAGLPFIATTPYAAGGMAFGELIKILANLIERKFDTKKEFMVTEKINISDTGSRHKAGFYLITDHRANESDKSFPDAYTINADCILVDKATKEPYLGDIPYIVISIDGKESRSLSSFEASLATAEMLNRYFGEKDQKDSIEQILEGATYCSDLYYRKRVDELDQQILDLGPEASAEKVKELQAVRDAYAKNIVNDLMKKKK
jgi:hypothetical protein